MELREDGLWLTRTETAAFLGLSLGQLDHKIRPKLAEKAWERKSREVLLHGPSVAATYLVEYGKLQTPKDLLAARIREKEATAELKELQLAETKGQVCQVADMERTWSTMAIPFRRATDEFLKTYGEGAARIWRAAIAEAESELERLIKGAKDTDENDTKTTKKQKARR